MKKGLIVSMPLLAACMLAIGLGQAGAMKHPGGGMCPKMHKGGRECCCPMYRGMAKSMMKESMIATADGGIVVMVGNKLVKYDKDLNVQKEAEIKMDMDGMQKMMTEMRAACPMYKKMSEKCEKGQKGEHKKHKGHGEHEGHEE